MRKTLGTAAVLFSGLTLLLLVTLALASLRSSIERELEYAPLEAEPAELDPLVAQLDILDIRRSQGSVLSGSSLAQFETCEDFATPLAELTGAELGDSPLSAEPAKLSAASNPTSPVETLRRSATEYEQLANGLEAREQYTEADRLRELATETRKLARELAPASKTALLPGTLR